MVSEVASDYRTSSPADGTFDATIVHRLTMHSQAAMTVRPNALVFGSQQPSPDPTQDIPGLKSSSATVNYPVQTVGGDQVWDPNSRSKSWTAEHACNGLLDTTPSPMEGVSSSLDWPGPSHDYSQVQLLIDPINPKSRVETQINIKLTLGPIPAGVSKLHLPTHTISKAKLLAKAVTNSPDTLELSTMLFCSSAMEKDDIRDRAFRLARGEEDPLNVDVQKGEGRPELATARMIRMTLTSQRMERPSKYARTASTGNLSVLHERSKILGKPRCAGKAMKLKGSSSSTLPNTRTGNIWILTPRSRPDKLALSMTLASCKWKHPCESPVIVGIKERKLGSGRVLGRFAFEVI